MSIIVTRSPLCFIFKYVQILKVKCEEEVNGQKEREEKRDTTHPDVHPQLYMHRAPVSRIGVSVNHRLNRKLK